MLGKLNTFIILAECGSYTEAAKRLYCTQPSVSQQIRYLEDHYGTKLVTRKNSRIQLTERGVLLKQQAEQLLQLFEETEHVMSTNESEDKPVTLYMSNYIAEHYYNELFDENFVCCASCPWEINGQCYKELRADLLAKKTKFAIMPIYAADAEIQQTYEITPLFEEELYLVFSAKHSLAQRKVIYAKDLERVAVFQTQGVYMQNLIKQALTEKGVSAHFKQMTDFTIIKKALEHAGVSFMPKKALSHSDALVYRTVKGMRIVRQNGLVIDPHQELSRSEQAYCEHICRKLSS